MTALNVFLISPEIAPFAKTGGLADTVINLTENSQEGSGIVFEKGTVEDFQNGILRALEVYRDKEMWDCLRRRIMQKDFSWKQSAEQYLELYQNLLNNSSVKI